MSYIVPREKPKCYNCPFRTLDYCGLLIEHDCVRVNVNEMTVSEYCPLIEIPTPHGRLGDLDKLKADHSMKNDCAECEKELQGSSRACEYDRIYSKMDFCQWIDNAETVIEPEGGRGMKIVINEIDGTVVGNKVNLCDSCKHDFSTCMTGSADILFGDGAGDDNVCCCSCYEPIMKKEREVTE